MAQTYHGRALALTKTAIDDPRQNTTDKILLTILMLDFYERIGKTVRFQPTSGAHWSGAVALVEHRGSLNFQSETSKRLLVAVRHELIEKALEGGKSISPNPAIWTNSAPMPESPAIALDALMVELVNLKAFFDTADFPNPPSTPFGPSRSPSPGAFSAPETSIDVLHSILAPALDLDSRFALWPKSLPTFWHLITVGRPARLPATVEGRPDRLDSSAARASEEHLFAWGVVAIIVDIGWIDSSEVRVEWSGERGMGWEDAWHGRLLAVNSRWVKKVL